MLPSSATIQVDSNLGLGTASYSGNQIALFDFTSIPHSLSSPVPTSSATVSFDVEWSGIIQRGTVSNSSLRFALDFVETAAKISWRATTPKTSLQSTGVTKVNFAEIAHETNGVFF